LFSPPEHFCTWGGSNGSESWSMMFTSAALAPQNSGFERDVALRFFFFFFLLACLLLQNVSFGQRMLASLFIFISLAPSRPPTTASIPLASPLWVVVWVNLARGSMYIITTGLGFAGCHSINQSEFNYQASDGLWWQAPALVESISFGATAMGKKKKLKMRLLHVCVCLCVCVCPCEIDKNTRLRGKRVKQKAKGALAREKGKSKDSYSCNQPSKVLF